MIWVAIIWCFKVVAEAFKDSLWQWKLFWRTFFVCYFVFCFVRNWLLFYATFRKQKYLQILKTFIAQIIFNMLYFHYRGFPGGNVPDFGRMFLKLKYTDITKNTYIQSWTVTEIKAREKCGLLAVPRTVPGSRDVLPVHCACPSLITAGSSVFTLRLHM